MNYKKVSFYFLRYSLALSFLSAVADRFGIWGKSGSEGVVWGSFQSFSNYTGTLLYYVHQSLIPFFSWSATIIEIILGIFLIIGFRVKLTAYLSSALLALFALSMIIAFGFKAPLDYSVFTACAASLFLGLNLEKDA